MGGDDALREVIALIALARKFAILDLNTSPGTIAALAGALLALGAVYWLMRERDDDVGRRRLRNDERGARLQE